MIVSTPHLHSIAIVTKLIQLLGGEIMIQKKKDPHRLAKV
jgi:hypothetical protein